MHGWRVEIEGVMVTVSYYGNSDHNRRGGGLREGEGGGGVSRDMSEVGTGLWDRYVLPRGFPDMELGVRCHSCY